MSIVLEDVSELAIRRRKRQPASSLRLNGARRTKLATSTQRTGVMVPAFATARSRELGEGILER